MNDVNDDVLKYVVYTVYCFVYLFSGVHFKHGAKCGENLGPIILYVVGLCQQEGMTEQTSRGQLSLRRWSLKRVPQGWHDPPRLHQSHQEGGIQILPVEVVFHVVLLNLPPHFGHCVTLGPVPQKPHDVLVHTTSIKFDNQRVNREVIAVTSGHQLFFSILT